MEFKYSTSNNNSKQQISASGPIPTNLPKVLLIFIVGFLSMFLLVIPPLVLKYKFGIEPPNTTPVILISLLVVFIYCGFLLLYVLPKMGSWATTTKAIPNVSPISMNDLLKRLNGINSLDAPFVVKQGETPTELIVQWNVVNEKWIGLMFAGGLNFVYTLTIHLDENKHIARVREKQVSASWDASGPVPVLQSGFNFSFFQGINLFTYKSSQLTGILWKDGKFTLDNAYKYTFNPNEIKEPISQIITQSGWDFVPVVFF